jgi:hypothetical protein
MKNNGGAQLSDYNKQPDDNATKDVHLLSYQW